MPHELKCQKSLQIMHDFENKTDEGLKDGENLGVLKTEVTFTLQLRIWETATKH